VVKDMGKGEKATSKGPAKGLTSSRWAKKEEEEKGSFSSSSRQTKGLADSRWAKEETNTPPLAVESSIAIEITASSGRPGTADKPNKENPRQHPLSSSRGPSGTGRGGRGGHGGRASHHHHYQPSVQERQRRTPSSSSAEDFPGLSAGEAQAPAAAAAAAAQDKELPPSNNKDNAKPTSVRASYASTAKMPASQLPPPPDASNSEEDKTVPVTTTYASMAKMAQQPPIVNTTGMLLPPLPVSTPVGEWDEEMEAEDEARCQQQQSSTKQASMQ
jgi:hypothetical protein